MNNIISNIRKIRELKGYSQEFISEKMHITQAKYARFERGATKTDLDMVIEVAKVLDIKLIDLITYPAVYVEKGSINSDDCKLKTVLQIELCEDKKEQVLNVVFGEKNMKIIKEI